LLRFGEYAEKSPRRIRSRVADPLDAALLKYEFSVPVRGLPARLCNTDIVRMLVDLETQWSAVQPMTEFA